MSEILPNFNLELEIELQLLKAASEHLDREDIEFLDDLEDADAQLYYVYGRLIDLGKDPDDIIYGNHTFEGDKDEI